MSLKSDIREATRSLSSSKQRTLLAVIGITIGIGSVIAMVSVGKIIQHEALKQFMAMGTDILTINHSSGGFGGGPGRASGKISLKDAMEIPKYCPTVNLAGPYVQGMGGGSGTIYAGKAIPRASLYGVTQSFIFLDKLKIREGRFISDLDRHAYFCVIGDQVAQELRKKGAGEELVGEKIKINERMFTVIGVLEHATSSRHRALEPNSSILTHLTTLTRMNPDTAISNIKVRVGPAVDHKTATREIQDYFFKRKKIRDIRVRSPEELIEQMKSQMELYTLLLGAIGSISLIVGGVGVMNVMLVSVTERRREIGIRRALGAKRSNIKNQFLIEAIVLSSLGGVLGIALGIGAAYIAAHFGKWEFILSRSSVFLGFGVASAVGIFFGFYPAQQASKLDPIAALRSD